MVMIPQEEWLNLHEKLDNLAELVSNRNASDKDSEWIESDKARKMLGISPKTWQDHLAGLDKAIELGNFHGISLCKRT